MQRKVICYKYFKILVILLLRHTVKRPFHCALYAHADALIFIQILYILQKHTVPWRLNLVKYQIKRVSLQLVKYVLTLRACMDIGRKKRSLHLVAQNLEHGATICHHYVQVSD